MKKLIEQVGLVVLCLLATITLKAQTDSCGSEWLQTHYNSQDSSFWLMKKAIANRVEHYRQNKNKIINQFRFGPEGNEQDLVAGNCNKTTYLIPVVVHIDTTDTATNISDAQVQHQIDILNEAFDTAKIQFCLAQKRPDGSSFSGITRIGGANTSNKLDLQISQLAQLAYYSPTQYLNIYVVKDILTAAGVSSGVTGYNNVYPGQNGIDGVVVKYDRFGDASNCVGCNTLVSYSRGGVLVHEVGHYLGLLHTFQGDCSGIDSATCGILGDYCCDTRPQDGAVFACPTTPQQSCPTYHLSIFDNLTNYMGYANDTCLDEFTPDQIDLMHSTLEGPRSSLVNPISVNAKALSCCMNSPFFTVDNTLLCFNDTVTFTALEYSSSVKYRWIIADSNGTVIQDTLDSTTHIYKHFFSQINRYDITLQLIFGTNNDTVTFGRKGFIEKLDCSKPLQSIHANWYFGNSAGLRFTTAGAFRDIQPSQTQPNINTTEGTFGTSNIYGKRLFYAGALPIFDTAFNLQFEIDVYDEDYTVVSNAPLIGLGDASQGGVLVPMPGDGSKYYIFSVSDLTGFYYSIFDTTLNSGLGDIDTSFKNIPVPPPSGSDSVEFNGIFSHHVGEVITAIPKCNGTDYWILVVDYSNSANGQKLAVYSLTSSGLSFHSFLPFTVAPQGGIKVSPDGTRIAAPPHILDFNKSTATASIIRSIPTVNSYTFWSSSFSPNSNVFYYLQADSNSAPTSKLIQVDLLSSDSSTQFKEIGQFIHPNYMALQLAPDNKIYLSRLGVGQLAVIDAPDSIITVSSPNKCGFSNDGPLLSSGGLGGECIQGLPNNVDAKYPSEVPLSFAHKDSACSVISFRPNNCCATTYKWFFGDGDSSSQKSPEHTYATEGLYSVQLIVDGSDTVTLPVKIGIDKPVIAGNDTVSCMDEVIYTYSIANPNDYLTYDWAIDDGTIQLVDNLNNATVNWTGNGWIYLTAENERTGCLSKDSLHVLRVSDNDIDSSLMVDTVPCIQGSAVTLHGDDFLNKFYEWEWSEDGAQWTFIPGQYDSLLTYTMPKDSVFFRRRVINNDLSCYFYSNAIKVKSTIYIEMHPEDQFDCQGTGYGFGVSVHNPNGDTITYQWQYKLIDSTTWWDSYTTPSFTEGGSPATDSTKFRCIVSTPCGDIYSDSALLLFDNVATFTLHPQSALADEEGSVIFSAAANSKSQTTFQWYHSYDNGDVFYELPDETNDSLILTDLSLCQHLYQYKVGIRNACSDVYGTSISDTATLTVTQTRFADAWMKDGKWDDATEPNIVDSSIYNSPDIWNRRPGSSYDTIHENPDYDTANANLLYYRVRNDGVDTTKGGEELYLYWTLAGLGEKWPDKWTDNPSNYYNHLCSGSLYGNSYPEGGEINSIPIPLPPIPPGGEIIDTISWFPPNPYWYCVNVNGSPQFPTEKGICLLARIQTCDLDSFGMTRKEGSLIGPNVRNNNNIVTKNITVTNFNNIKKSGNTNWITFRNVNSDDPCDTVRFTALDPSYFLAGSVTIYIDDYLLAGWQTGGATGSGFTLIDSNTFTVSSSVPFVLDNVCVDDTTNANIGVKFDIDSMYTWLEDESYYFTLRQIGYFTNEENGGYDFQVNLTDEAPGFILPVQPKEDDASNSMDKEFSAGDLNADDAVKGFKVYPNPFTQSLNIEFFMVQEGVVKLMLTDMLGKPVAVISDRYFDKGQQKVSFLSKNLSAGMYFLTVDAPDLKRKVKVILQTH